MRPPKLIKPYVTRFAKTVVRADAVSLLYISAAPLPGAQQNDCFAIVQRQAAAHGGAMVVGWAVWEFPRLFIEAQFHAVWQQPCGALLDLTPRQFVIPRVLFLHDPGRQYLGLQVDSVRLALTADKDVKQLLALNAERFRLTHKLEGDRHYGQVGVPPQVEALDAQRERVTQKLIHRYGPWTAESV